MSAPGPDGTPGRPRAQLHALKAMWGTCRVVEGTEDAPRVIERKSPMGHFEIWRWVSGNGSKAWFERMGES